MNQNQLTCKVVVIGESGKNSIKYIKFIKFSS